MPVFDAGKIEGTLTLDRTPFNRELKKAQADARAFEKKPIKPKLSLDTSAFDRTMKKARAEIKKLETERPVIDINGDADDWEREFKKVLADTETLQRKAADVSIKGDADVLAAQEKLLRLATEVDALDRKDVDIHVDVDPGNTAIQRLSLLTTLLIGLAPATVPGIAGLTAATVGLSAAFGAAGGAMGIFAVGATGALVSAVKTTTELDKLRQKLDETTDAAARAEILKQITDITDDMSTSVREFSRRLDTAKGSWTAFTEATSPVTLFQAGRALEIFSAALVPLPGVVNALAPSFNSWLDRIDAWVSGAGYQKFLGFILTEGPPALHNLGQLMGNLVGTVGNLVQAFAPFGQDLLRSVVGLTERWQQLSAAMSGRAGFQDFIAYVRDVGPQFVDALTAIGRAVIDIGVAIAPLGGPALSIIESFAKTISVIAETAPGLLQAAIILTTFGRAALGLGDAVAAARARLDNFNRMMGSTGQASTRMGSALRGIGGFIGGPWGIAIAGATTALALFANQQANAQARSDQLKQSLDQESGAFTRISKESLAMQASDLKLTNIMSALGLSMETVTAAAMGNQAAIREVSDAANQGRLAANSGTHAFAEYGLSADQAKVEIADLQSFIRTSNDAFGEQRNAIDAARKVTGGYVAEGSKLKFATREGAAAHAEAGRKIQGQVNALQALMTMMQAARMEALRIKNAQINYEQSLDDTNAAIKANGRNHDISTQKGRDNWRALLAQADAQSAYVDDVKFTSRSVKDQIAILGEQRRAFIEDARAMGFSKERAAELADQYLKMPKEVRTKAKLEAQKEELEDWKKGIKTLDELSPETRAKLKKDAGALLDWTKDLFGLEKIKPETKTKLNKDTGNLSIWERLLAGISKKEETDTELNKDTGGVNSWKSLLNSIIERKLTRLEAQANTGPIYAFRSALASIDRSITTVITSVYRSVGKGHDGGLVTGAGIIPAYADGGPVRDMRNGGRLPGFSNVDDQLALLRLGEEVAVPETGAFLRQIGLDIPGLNALAKSGKLRGAAPEPRGGTSAVSSKPGRSINVDKIVINNPSAQPSESSIYDTIDELNMLYG